MAFTCLAQKDRLGHFPEYQELGVKRLTRYYVSFQDSLQDTSIVYRESFNKKGYKTKYEWPSYFGFASYTYDYNDFGFLTYVDTSGFYGTGVPGFISDTSESHIEETWEHFGNISRIINRVRSSDRGAYRYETDFIYDSQGRLIAEKSYSLSKDYKEQHFNIVKYLFFENGLPKETQNCNGNGEIYLKRFSVYEYY